MWLFEDFVRGVDWEGLSSSLAGRNIYSWRRTRSCRTGPPGYGGVNVHGDDVYLCFLEWVLFCFACMDWMASGVFCLLFSVHFLYTKVLTGVLLVQYELCER